MKKNKLAYPKSAAATKTFLGKNSSFTDEFKRFLDDLTEDVYTVNGNVSPAYANSLSALDTTKKRVEKHMAKYDADNSAEVRNAEKELEEARKLLEEAQARWNKARDAVKALDERRDAALEEFKVEEDVGGAEKAVVEQEPAPVTALLELIKINDKRSFTEQVSLPDIDDFKGVSITVTPAHVMLLWKTYRNFYYKSHSDARDKMNKTIITIVMNATYSTLCKPAMTNNTPFETFIANFDGIGLCRINDIKIDGLTKLIGAEYTRRQRATQEASRKRADTMKRKREQQQDE